MRTLHTIACLQQIDPQNYSQSKIIDFGPSESCNTSTVKMSKKGKEHDVIEHWLGHHNRKFEMLRTITGFISAMASSVVLLKVFNII
jgi:hypothetical protein